MVRVLGVGKDKRDGSAAKTARYSSIGPEFDSQHRVFHLLGALAPEDPTPSSSLCG